MKNEKETEHDMYIRLSNLAMTDLGNSKLMIELYGNELRYAKKKSPGRGYRPSGGWLVWNGKEWQRDAEGEVLVFAQKTALRIGDMADALKEDGQTKEAEAWRKWGLKSQNTPRLMAMIAQAKPHLTIPGLLWVEMAENVHGQPPTTWPIPARRLGF